MIRPTAAALLGVSVLFAIALIGGALWLAVQQAHRQQAAAALHQDSSSVLRIRAAALLATAMHGPADPVRAPAKRKSQQLIPTAVTQVFCRGPPPSARVSGHVRSVRVPTWWRARVTPCPPPTRAGRKRLPSTWTRRWCRVGSRTRPPTKQRQGNAGRYEKVIMIRRWHPSANPPGRQAGIDLLGERGPFSCAMADIKGRHIKSGPCE
jgi:hypothetical protein